MRTNLIVVIETVKSLDAIERTINAIGKLLDEESLNDLLEEREELKVILRQYIENPNAPGNIDKGNNIIDF